jgi:hypothetical protein
MTVSFEHHPTSHVRHAADTTAQQTAHTQRQDRPGRVSQAFIQLVMSSVVMVGQNILGRVRQTGPDNVQGCGGDYS